MSKTTITFIPCIISKHTLCQQEYRCKLQIIKTLLICVSLFVVLFVIDYHTNTDKHDYLVQLFNPYHEKMVNNIPYCKFLISSILFIQYISYFFLVMKIIYDENMNVFIKVCLSYCLLLLLSYLRYDPPDPDRIQYYKFINYPLESIVSDHIVSWHILICYLISEEFYKIFQKKLLILIVCCINMFLLMTMLLATKNTNTMALIIALAMAASADFLTDTLVQKYNSICEHYRANKAVVQVDRQLLYKDTEDEVK